MFYVVNKQSPRYHQMTLEELLFSSEPCDQCIASDPSGTRTFVTNKIPFKYSQRTNIPALIVKLKEFNAETAELRSVDRKSLYYEFYIPKRSGGLRKIDAPNDELKLALYKLKSIFENDFHALYHTSAFAYVKGRCTIDAVKRHQQNKSRWFGKLDLSNFFGSTTLEFVMSMFSMIFPFSEVVKYDSGKRELERALELAFLDGGLPQGTPISPLITNVMMIPIDFELSNDFRDYNKQHFIYTRYADDFIISSQYDFKVSEIEQRVKDVLRGFNAPFSINTKKTRYGSSSGSNYNLGVLLNKDNMITIGRQKKKSFEIMLSNYGRDRLNGVIWDRSDINVMAGLRSYYTMVEGEVINRIIQSISQKLGIDIVKSMKEDLKS